MPGLVLVLGSAVLVGAPAEATTGPCATWKTSSGQSSGEQDGIDVTGDRSSITATSFPDQLDVSAASGDQLQAGRT